MVRPESDCVGDDTRQESDLYLICPDPGSCQHTTPTPTLVSHEVWAALTARMSTFIVETGDNNVATNHSYTGAGYQPGHQRILNYFQRGI